MNDRPVLNKHLDGDTFRSYYYLKEELTAFCRQNGIPASGGKLELTDRIAHFLDTGEISAASKKPKTKPVYTEITEDTLIEPNFVCSEVHRAMNEKRNPVMIRKRFPAMIRKSPPAMNRRRAKRAGVWLWVSVWGLFSVWFLEKPYSETWAQALP